MLLNHTSTQFLISQELYFWTLKNRNNGFGAFHSNLTLIVYAEKIKVILHLLNGAFEKQFIKSAQLV